jgi:hypothetical protein
MLRSSLYTAGALLICTSAFGQNAPKQYTQRSFTPITAPIHNIEGTLDLRTGKFTRQRNATIGDDGKQEVYDNTCPSGFYIGLAAAGFATPTATNVTGSAFAETFGDYGAIPSTQFNAGAGLGDNFCTVGCADDYDITQFEIAWCQLAAPVTGAVIELNFWNTPQASCQLGTQPGNNPTGGVHNPGPATSTVLSATLLGLPRSNQIGTLACYFLNINLVTPGFNLNGSNTFGPGATAGDKFAWSFSIPSGTGSDGPIIAGNVNLSTPCLPCEGTIWEVGGQTTNVGSGAGQDGTFFEEDYGGTSVGAGAGDCYVFGGANPPSGFHLELFADKPCQAPPIGVSFCDGNDGSLASCPCSPGDADSGCAGTAGMAGITNGVKMTALIQQTTPLNRATMQSTGFPVAGTPGGVLFRNNGIDPSSPVVFGDGIRCVDSAASPTTFVRIGGSTAVSGTMNNSFGHNAMAGVGSFFYQLWYRSTPISYCDPLAAFNLSNGVSIVW